MVTKTPNPVDRHVGSRVRMRRMISSISQEKLGEALGLTFQQIQKYEKGSNRISASRLQQIAKMLNVPVSFFFEGAPDEGGHGALAAESFDATAHFIPDFLPTTEGLRLAKAFARIKSAAVRRRVIDLVEVIAEREPVLD